MIFLPRFSLRLCLKVATELGDLQLAGKCRINVAYNYIWLGQYAEAQRIIRAQVGRILSVKLGRANGMLDLGIFPELFAPFCPGAASRNEAMPCCFRALFASATSLQMPTLSHAKFVAS